MINDYQLKCLCVNILNGCYTSVTIGNTIETKNESYLISFSSFPYSCECLEGFSGLQCQEEDSDCASSPCPDRAMCRNEPGIGNYTCLCKSGYTGESCDVTVDPCGESPCFNGATCESYQQGRFGCICPPGWEGPLCDQNIDDCAESPCLLGANCTDLVDDFTCDCPNGFGGKRCETKIDLCSRAECVNGACVDKLFRYE